MKNISIEHFRKLAHREGDNEILEAIIKLWDSVNPKATHINKINSFQYTFRILDILKNEFNAYSTTILSAALSLYYQFYGNKNQLNSMKNTIDKEVENIAAAFLEIKKLSTSNISYQADNYRSLLLNVGGDLRSVLISMAENILNLRFYNQINNQIKKQSTLDLAKYVYIPLAHRLGFYKLKAGMEDLVLSYEKPEEYISIKNKLKESEGERLKIIDEFIEPISKELKEHGLKFKIKGRTKSIFSIYTKMQKQSIPFEKVFDLWATRIIIESEAKNEKADCWHTFSVVTNLYNPSLSRMRDWISVPRENGYESLHITVETPDKRWVEVQIRTTRMDDEAENGMASHWRYKNGNKGESYSIDFWLTQVRKALEKEDGLLGKKEFKAGKFSTELFAFTPNGDLKKLNIGATVLDFAFAIHTELGMKCTGAIVNGKNTGIKHHLKNGDQVEILTSKNQKPSLDWLNIVTSTRAKNRIKKAFDEKGKLEAQLGKDILLRRLKNWKLDFNQDLLETLASEFNYKSINNMYQDIYFEKINILDIKRLLTDDNDSKNEDEEVTKLTFEEEQEQFDYSSEDDNSDILVIDQLDNINYNLAKCCHPIPGDEIFGFVTVSKGITIHRKNCPNAKDLKERYPYRIIPSLWKQKENKLNFKAEIFIKGIDQTGFIAELSNMINNKLGISILNINFNSNGAEFQGKVIVKVYNLEELRTLILELGSINSIIEVYRAG